MSRSLNKVTLIGNVGKDPVIRTVGSNGNKVANFSLATSRSWKNAQGEAQEKTEWHRIVVWGKLAEIVEKFVTKGDKLYLEGELQYGSFQKDNVDVPTAEINADQLILLGSVVSASAGEKAMATSAPQGGDDDLPF